MKSTPAPASYLFPAYYLWPGVGRAAWKTRHHLLHTACASPPSALLLCASLFPSSLHTCLMPATLHTWAERHASSPAYLPLPFSPLPHFAEDRQTHTTPPYPLCPHTMPYLHLPHLWGAFPTPCPCLSPSFLFMEAEDEEHEKTGDTRLFPPLARMPASASFTLGGGRAGRGGRGVGCMLLPHVYTSSLLPSRAASLRSLGRSLWLLPASFALISICTAPLSSPLFAVRTRPLFAMPPLLFSFGMVYHLTAHACLPVRLVRAALIARGHSRTTACANSTSPRLSSSSSARTFPACTLIFCCTAFYIFLYHHSRGAPRAHSLSASAASIFPLLPASASPVPCALLSFSCRAPSASLSFWLGSGAGRLWNGGEEGVFSTYPRASLPSFTHILILPTPGSFCLPSALWAVRTSLGASSCPASLFILYFYLLLASLLHALISSHLFSFSPALHFLPHFASPSLGTPALTHALQFLPC